MNTESTATEVVINKYQLSGGSTVTVIKPYGERIYVALVMITDNYPEVGSYALNVNRKEHLYVINGEFNVIVNSTEYRLKANDSVLIENNDKYQIKAVVSGVILATVFDSNEAETQIIVNN